MTSQFSDVLRKDIDLIADATSLPTWNFQQSFLLHIFDGLRRRDILHYCIIVDVPPYFCSSFFFNKTAQGKIGSNTPSVQHRQPGRSRQNDNCAIAVHLNYMVKDVCCLIDDDLFLLEEWADGQKRYRVKGISDDIMYCRPNWRNNLEMCFYTMANGVRFEWLEFDDGYGKIPEFLFVMNDWGGLSKASEIRCKVDRKNTKITWRSYC